VLFPEEFHRSRSLARTLRTRGFEYHADRDFDAVIRACAAPRRSSPGTWITSEMQAAYLELHRLGFAHSAEIWRDGRLVGGVYGVQLGRVYFGESMFSLEPDASKAALDGLVRRGLSEGLAMIDCQMPSPHLRALGSRSIARAEFLARLTAALDVDES
jgi:leucyl/phenylalanyl-tRNA--protein transferase